MASKCARGGNAPACPGEALETADEQDVEPGPPTSEDPVRDAAEVELPLMGESTDHRALVNTFAKEPHFARRVSEAR